MELLHNFGIDIRLLVAQIINFAIVFWILKKFLYKPVLDLLKNRENAIKEGLLKAEEARILLEKTVQEEKDILKNAQKEAKKLLEETQKQQVEMMKATEEITKKQTEKMIQEARNQISFETKEAEKRLATHVSELAITFLQKSIRELFSEKDQEIIMKNALKNFRKHAD